MERMPMSVQLMVGTVSNEFVISIAGMTDTERTATFRSAVSNQQELSLSELRSLQFLAAENASGLADFSFEVTDSGAATDANGNENSLTQTLTLDILNFNDIPELPEVQIVFDGTQSKQAGQEDTDYTFTAADLLAGVVDPDILYNPNGSVQERPYGDILVVDSLSVTNGSVSDDGLGNYTFTPDDDFYGTARINYLIKDGQGGSISNLVELTIDSVNDAPIATFATDQNTAEGNSAIGGQLTSTDVDTHATTATTNNIPNVESASYSYVSAFIDDFDSSFAAGQLSASLKHADGTALLATETVQFVDATFTTTGGVTTEVTDIASIDGLTIDANGSLTLDTSGAFYDGLSTADDLIEIIVEYSVDNSDTSTSTTNEFRVHVTSNDGGTTREASFARGIDVVNGLVINPDGDWTFDPGDGAYDYLSAGDTQEIDVQYQVEDEDGATATNRFSIYVNGTNDAPVATFNAAQSATEDSVNAFATDDGAGNYTFDLATFIPAADATLSVREFTVTDINGDETAGLTEIPGLTLGSNDTNSSFNVEDNFYSTMSDGDVFSISAVYESTGNGVTAANTLYIYVYATEIDGVVERTATLYSASTVGQLTATDVDRGTVFRYESVGAPIDGLFIDETTGSWSFDSSHESYQDLKQGETLDITVNYSVFDEENTAHQNSFVITLTGSNDAPVLTGVTSALPGGSEDTDYTITKAQLLAGFTDQDAGETATLRVENLVAKNPAGDVIGTFVADDNTNPQQWVYTPADHYFGEVKLSYDVVDDQNAATAADSSFALASVNDIPLQTGALTVFAPSNEDSTVTISADQLLEGFTDADGDFLSILGLSASGGVISQEEVVFAAPAVTPNTFSFYAGGEDNWQVEATGLAAPVEGTQQPDPTFTVNGGANAALFEVNADGVLSFIAGSEPAYQALAEGSTDNSANQYEVIVEVSAGDQTTSETITVTVEDSTAPMIVGIHDQGISEAATQLSLVEGNKEVLQLSAFDNAGGAVTGYWSIVENVDTNNLPVDNGDLFTIDDANNLVFKATPSFVDGGNNVYQLTVSVSDNADPTAVGANTREVEIEVAVYETPDYVFNPNPDFNGTVELNYVVSDGNGGNQLATNTLTISPLNDAPERIAGNVSTLFLVEDAPLTSMGLEDVEYGVGGGSDEESSQSLTYTVSSVPADIVGRIYTADDGTTTSDLGVLSGQMKGDGTTGFAVSAASMVDSSGEYQDLNTRGIAGLTINDDGSYSFDAQDAFYNGVTTAAGVVSGELIGAGTAGYAFASATTRDGLTGDFQDVAGSVAGLTINDDGSFSFNTQDAAYDDLADGDTRQINVIYNYTSGV